MAHSGAMEGGDEVAVVGIVLAIVGFVAGWWAMTWIGVILLLIGYYLVDVKGKR